jgi:hypothetical protein
MKLLRYVIILAMNNSYLSPLTSFFVVRVGTDVLFVAPCLQNLTQKIMLNQKLTNVCFGKNQF